MCRNTVFKENNNLVLSGKDYLESFLVGALSVGALHAKSVAVGINTDVKTMNMDIKLPDGTYVGSDVINRYLGGNATESDVKQIKQLGSSINEENMNSVLKRMDDIANVKMGKETYGEMNKKTAGMSAYDKISYFSDVMSSPEFKAHSQELMKTAREQRAKAEGKKGVEGVDTGNNGVNNNDSKTERISSNPDNPNINPNDAGSLQTSANPNDNNGDGLGNAGTMLANKTPDPQKPNEDIPMEKAANGYEYDSYGNTDVNSNNLNNKPLSMQSRSEGQGEGNDVDVYNKGADENRSGSNGIDTDNGLSENNQVNNITADNAETENQVSDTGINAEGKTDDSIINQEIQNNAAENENGIANSDGMGYKEYNNIYKHKIIKKSKAEEVNNWWKSKRNYKNPPYKLGTDVDYTESNENDKYRRVYDKDNSDMDGQWIMRAEDINGLTPEEIKDKYALPFTPKFICDVKLQVGTPLRTGIANEIEGWGKGGGIQCDLMGNETAEFINERILK